MTPARRKIAILGGGMAALSAAYQLTRTDALRAAHEVTVYQIGWRLGGKGATGRDDQMRILEHGLHIWFGYYDNAFRMLRDVYRDVPPHPGDAMTRWTDALQPHDFTPIGPDYFPLHWPRNCGVPGDGHLFWTPWQAFTQMLGMLAATIETWHDARAQRGEPHASPVLVSPKVAQHLDDSDAPTAIDGRRFAHAHHALRAAHQWARTIGPTHRGDLQHHLPSLAELVHQTSHAFEASLPSGEVPADTGLVHELLDIADGFTHGFVHDLMLEGRTARELDDQEFRAWLMAHGSDPEIVGSTFIVRALYDTMFQYVDGDLAKPSYGAGTAAQVILRMFGGTQGAAMYEMQAGMGEVVVSPLYRLLKARGVRFEFFRDVQRLELAPGGREVARVHLGVQADTVDDRPYQPLLRHAGLDCWPAQPHWSQLKNGEALRAAGIDFESPWNGQAPVRHEVLQQGRDFDTVVLGICLGAFKKLNGDPTLADELYAAHPRFRAMSECLSLLPSLAVQLWSPRTLAELGWTELPPATVANAEPLDIWADMSQTLKYEGHEGLHAPKSVHYLTGVLKSELFRRPRSARGTQAEAETALTRIATDWIERHGLRMWPAAKAADGEFDWNVLACHDDRHGAARLHAQYVRANVSPAECCVVSAAGTAKHRLKAGDSGVANLVLAGTWIDTGFNTECIEAAVMSGMQAARAICGEPVHVIGEDLLQVPGHGFGSRVLRLLDALCQRMPSR